MTQLLPRAVPCTGAAAFSALAIVWRLARFPGLGRLCMPGVLDTE